MHASIKADNAPNLIGRWASNKVGASSEGLINFMLEHQMAALSTFQQTQWRERYTWQRGNTRTLIDWFVVPLVWRSYHINAEGTTRWGMSSDHKAIKITIPGQKQVKKTIWTPPKSRSIAEQGLFWRTPDMLAKSMSTPLDGWSCSSSSPSPDSLCP